jgi:hypothetical protein
MFEHFKTVYGEWKTDPKNKNATIQDKNNFLAEIANIIPGVQGASSTSESEKIAFLKSMVEPTNHNVNVGFPGQSIPGSNAVSRGFKEPGVAPAALTILGIDSVTLARTIIQGYKDRESVSLPVHDAEVKGIGEYKNTEEYNRKFYLTNRDYSIMQEFADAMTRLANEPNATAITLFMSVGGVNQRVTFKQMASRLANTNEAIQKRRNEIFAQDMKIGQMVGENGSMAEIKADNDTKPTPPSKAPKAKSTKPVAVKPEVSTYSLQDYAKVLLTTIKDKTGVKVTNSTRRAFDIFANPKTFYAWYGTAKNTIEFPDFKGLLADKKLIARLAAVRKETLQETQQLVSGEIGTFLEAMTEVHEYIHAGSMKFMAENPNDEKTRYVDRLYQEVTSNAKKENLKILNIQGGYWTKDRDEFLAVALSNPDMIQYLNRLKVKEGNKRISRFTQLVNKLAQMAGIKVDSEGYALAQIFVELADATSTAQKEAAVTGPDLQANQMPVGKASMQQIIDNVDECFG